MKSIIEMAQWPLSGVVWACALAASAAAWAVNDQPLNEGWAPSEWGSDDKAGSVNRTTPELVLKAVKLVKRGKVATLGKAYQQDAPAFGSRGWQMTIPGLPTGGPFGDQALVYNDEYLSTEIGQIGTQFDGPGHIGVITSKGMYFYNGRFLEDPDVGTYGLGPLPIPKSSERGDPGIVTDDDIKEMVRRQGIDPIGEGDCVFLYTGHGDIWHPSKWDTFDAAEKQKRIGEFNAGEPGFGTSGCEYLASRKIILWGGDTWATEAVGPGFAGETAQPFECHIKMMTKHGIWNLENLDFSQLVADKAYEFLFVWSPLKIKGGTGSPGNPIALY